MRATLLVHPTEQFSRTSFDLDTVRQNVGEIATGQEQRARSSDKAVSAIATDQEQMTRSIEETAARIAQFLSAKATGITVESRADAASLPPTARLNVKRTEAKPPQRKQPSAASGHDDSCFASASAVLQNHPGASPTWTLRAPSHEGTVCWYAAARPKGYHRARASDHRNEMTRSKEAVGTAENAFFALFAPRGPIGSWDGGLP
jgi:hypothetical protein